MATVTVTPDQPRFTIANSNDTFVADQKIEGGVVLTLLPKVVGIEVDAALAARSTFILPDQGDYQYVPDTREGKLLIKDAQGRVVITLPLERDEDQWSSPLIARGSEKAPERCQYPMN